MRRLGLLLTVAAALLTACSTPTTPAALRRASASTTTSAVPAGDEPAITITATAFDVHAAIAPAAATVEEVKAAVLATLNRYLEAGVLRPLRTGGPAGDLGPFFTAGARARASSPPDRFAFIDEGVPPLSAITAENATVALVGLAGTDRTIAVVDAVLDLRLRGSDGPTPVTVVRTGELLLVPEGDGWKIDGYDIRAARDSRPGPKTTAAKR